MRNRRPGARAARPRVTHATLRALADTLVAISTMGPPGRPVNMWAIICLMALAAALPSTAVAQASADTGRDDLDAPPIPEVNATSMLPTISRNVRS